MNEAQMANSRDTEHVELVFNCDGTTDVSWAVGGATICERLNATYSLSLDLATENTDAEPLQMLGSPAKLTLTRGSVMRQITGIVSRVHEGSTHPEMVTAGVTIVPALEALRHCINTRIFQEMTVPEILEEVLGEGLGQYERRVDNRTSRSYPTCEYRVQYGENDLDFCERLMEEEGIAYWFEFEDEAETLVLADSAREWGEIETSHGGAVQFSLQQTGVGGHEFMSELHGESSLRPTKFTTRHFDWTHPSVFVEGDSDESAEDDRPNGGSLPPDREIYEHDERPLTLSEYGGAAYGANDVDDQATIRRQSQAWESFICEGESTVLNMKIASVFELIGHTRPEMDNRYLVVEVSHIFGVQGSDYHNEVICVPDSVIYRPLRTKRKPRVASLQTATVTGPSGEEIHTDEHGRLKVQFHWDRLGAFDEHSSCWVRVMQPWSGAGWGHVFIPRIGMEVTVGFVEGDPDRPLVMGSVYNADHPPPYPLPDEKTKSTIKTETSLGGGGFNELRFEDKAGEEEIFIHAQKDENEVVENDHTTTVGNDQTITVGNDQTQEIGNNQTEHVSANQDLEVDANRTIQVHGDFSETIDGSETRTVSSGVTETIDSGENRTVTGGMTETITGGRTQTINGDSKETVNGSLTQTIAGGATITTPASYEVTANGGMNITAPGGITIIAPAGFNLVAPGGQTTIDLIFDKIGGQHEANFAYSIGDCLNKQEVVASLNRGMTGCHIETFATKVEFAGLLRGKKDVQLNTSACKLKTCAAQMLKIGSIMCKL